MSTLHAIFRHAALILWGIFTLVLLFIVFLLSSQLIQMGRSPWSLGFVQESLGEDTVPLRNADETQEITIYFGDKNGLKLVPEKRGVELTDSTIGNCRLALDELILGPRGELTPVFPEVAQVRALYALDEGELVVDLSRDAIPARRSSAGFESLMIQSLANTLTQPALRGKGGPTITRVRLLLEGAPVAESLTEHIDMTSPYGPDRGWISADTDTRTNG